MSLAEKWLQISFSLPSIYPVARPHPLQSHPKFANNFVEVMATVQQASLLANSYASAFHTQIRSHPWMPSSIPPS